MRRLLAFTTAMGATACGHERGYQVVDPMPPPPRCAGVAKSMTATATWKESHLVQPDGTTTTRWTILVVVTAPTLAGAKLVPHAQASDPNSLIVSMASLDDGSGVVVTVDAERARAGGGFALPVECEGAPGPGAVSLYLETPPPPGVEGLRVEISDQ